MTEAAIQKKIQTRLEGLGWWVKNTHGSQYQQGIPDIIAGHPKYGPRFIEVKNPAGFSFTAAQIKEFAEMITHGIPIYVLTSDRDTEIAKLFGPSNYWKYSGQTKGTY